MILDLRADESLFDAGVAREVNYGNLCFFFVDHVVTSSMINLLKGFFVLTLNKYKEKQLFYELEINIHGYSKLMQLILLYNHK